MLLATHRINVIGYHGAEAEALRHLQLDLETSDREVLLAQAERHVRESGYAPYEGESSVRYDYGDGTYCIDVPVQY